MTSSTSNVACCCFASFSSRLRCATFVSRPAADDPRRRTAFGALGRFALVVVRRRFFMASLPAARVPIAALLPPRHREYRNTPAASCSPQGQEMASYRLRPMLWKGLCYLLRRISRQRLSYIRWETELSGNSGWRDASLKRARIAFTWPRVNGIRQCPLSPFIGSEPAVSSSTPMHEAPMADIPSSHWAAICLAVRFIECRLKSSSNSPSFNWLMA